MPGISGGYLGQPKRIEYLNKLKKLLNPITQYQLPDAGNILSNSQNWNII